MPRCKNGCGADETKYVSEGGRDAVIKAWNVRAEDRYRAALRDLCDKAEDITRSQQGDPILVVVVDVLRDHGIDSEKL
jgi:hypothetical protein